MNGELWTKERDAQLRKLRAQGYSANQIGVKIGVKIGVSRNAVIGRAHRLGLKGQPRSTKPKAVHKPRPFKRRAPFRPPDMKTEPLPTMDQQSKAPVTLLDLEPHHCRWPVSDAPYVFCGDTKQDGSSYCGHHHGVSRRVGNQS